MCGDNVPSKLPARAGSSSGDVTPPDHPSTHARSPLCLELIGMEIRLERFAMYDRSSAFIILLQHRPASERSIASCRLLCEFVHEMVIKFNPWTALLGPIRACVRRNSKKSFKKKKLSTHTFPNHLHPSRHRHLLRRK